ncbi:MAG TPA: sialidase family protein, partial [Bryobacteraceae bacterium]
MAAADPSHPDVMYVGATDGGIWKTTNWSNSSPTWTPLVDQSQILSIAVREHSLVVFPGNSNIVLAAASGPGGGILRSEDAGNTWSYFANSKFDLAEFGAIVVDPNVSNAQTLYVAITAGVANFVSGSGLYKSTDGGANWTDAGSGTFSGNVSDLIEIQETGKTVLYAADINNGQANSGGIYRSDDGGATWHTTNFPTNTNGYHCFRLAGSTQPTERIYAAAIDGTGAPPRSGVVTRFVSTGMGGSWTTLTWPDAPGADNPGQSHRYRHNVLAVDPANSSTVFVNTDLETNMTHNRTEWIYKSTDAGQTWVAAGGDGDPASGMFDANGSFVGTGDNGVYTAFTGSSTYKGGNLDTAPYYSFSLDPNSVESAYAAMQDAPGTLKYSGSLTWPYFQPSVGQGEAGKLRVDPTNASRVYYLDPNTGDPANAPTTAARFVHSDEGGTTSWAPNWIPAITGLATHLESGTPITNYANYLKCALVLDPSSPERLLLGLNSVFETQTGGDPNSASLFGGKGWRDIGVNMGNGGETITAIALAPSDPHTVYAGTDDGRVFKTSDAQDATPSWSEVDSGLPTQVSQPNTQLVMALVVSPTNPGNVYAVTTGFLGRDDDAPDFSGYNHVWTRNGGGWTSVNGNLPTKLGADSLAVDWEPATPVLYVGTLRGVYTSTNLGTSWTRMTSFPRTRVTDLDLVPSLHVLGAGTLGRGAWEIYTQAVDTTTTYTGDTSDVAGSTANVSATLVLKGTAVPIPGETIMFTIGSQSCSNTTDSTGLASCSINLNQTAGPYTVKAKFAGTNSYNGSSDSKSFNITKATPTIATSPSAATTLGHSISDMATVSGGFNPSGTVTFDFYGYNDTTCGSSPVFTSTNPLSGGHATSSSYTPTLAGPYHITARYNGDSSNNPVSTNCADESVMVSATSVTGTGTIFTHNNQANFNFTISDKNGPLTGTLTYTDVKGGMNLTSEFITEFTVLGPQATIRGGGTITNSKP